MGSFVRHVDRLREATGAHVMIVHHTGKALDQGARGHSLLRAAVDTEIEISRQEVSRQSVALVTKQRDEDTGTSIAFKLRVVELGYDEDGETITSCVLQPADGPADSKPRKSLQGIPKAAFDILTDCIAREGQPAPPSDHIPNGARGCHIPLWRAYLEAGQILN